MEEGTHTCTQSFCGKQNTFFWAANCGWYPEKTLTKPAEQPEQQAFFSKNTAAANLKLAALHYSLCRLKPLQAQAFAGSSLCRLKPFQAAAVTAAGPSPAPPPPPPPAPPWPSPGPSGLTPPFSGFLLFLLLFFFFS